ncbi:MAG TPA: glycosyltransferase family 87 protein [Vicinamibacterales bacterium]|nr:glycosyltransferase family 87 protein [Vicinamibacterales bacterium]
MRDFEVYWTAAARAASAEPLYRPSDGHYQFKYLPAFAVLSAPVARLPLPHAKAAWFAASAALLVVFVSLSLAILPARRRPSWGLALIVVIAMGKFYGHELTLGQVNLLFGVIATAGILMIRAGRDAAAAALFVAAIAVKPYAIVFLPWIALVRGRRAGVTAVAATAALLALPVVLYGLGGTIDLHRAWWATVTESTAPNLTNADNVSVAGMFAKWFGARPAASVASLLASAALVAAAALVIARRREIAHAEALEGALLLTLIPLLSPQGWDYVFLVATPAVAMFANYDDLLPDGVRWLTWAAVVVAGLSLFDLMGRERYAVFMSWSVITVCFFVLVTALVSLRIRRAA